MKEHVREGLDRCVGQNEKPVVELSANTKRQAPSSPCKRAIGMALGKFFSTCLVYITCELPSLGDYNASQSVPLMLPAVSLQIACSVRWGQPL